MSSVQIVTWATLKPILAAAPVDHSYLATTDFYYIYTSGRVILVTMIARDGGTDVTEYETSYKTSAIAFNYTEINLYKNITGNATTVIKSGSGLLHAVIISDNTTGGVVNIYDNTAGSGTKICGPIQIGSPSGGLLSTSGQQGPVNIPALDVKFSTGLTVVTTGSTGNSITVIYR